MPPLLFPDKVTLPPAQKVVGPLAVMTDATARGVIVVIIWLEVTVPQAFVLVIKKSPAVLTCMVGVVAPVLKVPPLLFPESVILPPAQIVVGPLAVITGTGGGMPNVIELLLKLMAPAVVKAFPVSEAPCKKLRAPAPIIEPIKLDPSPNVAAPLT